MQETRVQSLGRKDPLQKEMAAHSSLLAWEIPWVRSLVGYSPQGCRVGHNLATKTQQIERTEPLVVQAYKQLCGPHRTFLRRMALSLCTLCQLWNAEKTPLLGLKAATFRSWRSGCFPFWPWSLCPISGRWGPQKLLSLAIVRRTPSNPFAAPQKTGSKQSAHVH